MNKKPYIYKRMLAYLVDIIIVTLISSMIAVIFVDNTEYTKDSERMVELAKKLAAGEIEGEEYYRETNNLNYELTKNSTEVTMITLGVSIVYFVILCYYCGGITLGKYLMKIKIVSANGKKLNIGHYFLRCLVIDLVLSHSISLILFYTLSKTDFINCYDKVSRGITILLLLSFILIMFRNDGRSISDFMGNTKIVNFNDEEQEPVEATVVEEKKIVNKKPKNSKKKEVK